jgi:NAD(P)-dependent dehydrogenase (short-subunit alcohol dehydrogenase family)
MTVRRRKTTVKPQRVAVITGAAGGIGRALVNTFAREGYHVIGIDRKKCRLPHAECISFDLAKLHLWCTEGQEFIKNLQRICGGRVNALVNNAAVQIVKPVAEVEPQDWDQTIAVNLLAPFWLTLRLLPQLKRCKGSVINIASIHARLTKPYFSLYATSKVALVGLTRSLAVELAPPVRVNAILPAATRTRMLMEGFCKKSNSYKEIARYHPLQRIAQPAEIAAAALYLAGDQASFITGATLDLDGGIGGCLCDPQTT